MRAHTSSRKLGVSEARAAAFDILLRVEREDAYASELLHAEKFASLSAADHGLTTELVMGVLRWRSRLDEEVATASSQPLKKLDAEILTALRMGVYQLGWLDRVPQRAALNESVELVKRARKRSAAPFVNAVLRKLASPQRLKPHPQERGTARLKPCPSTLATATLKPGPSTLATARLKPCPSTEEQQGPAALERGPEELARVWAHPLWLVERWVEQYGRTATEAICKQDQTVPATAIRLRATELEAESGITLAPGALLATARRVMAGNIAGSELCRAGKIAIQDEGSQLIAALVGRGERILDCCAAPGGKTLAMADRNPEAKITAVELHPHRARLLGKLLGAHPRIQVVVGDARELRGNDRFDRILADVPCSGTGTLARHPEIKWRLTPADLGELQERQRAILRAALDQLAPGGRLVYSTCSLEKEENEDVVEAVLSESGALRLVDCREELEKLKSSGELMIDPNSLTRGSFLRTIPGVHPCDGFFAAVMERIL